MHPSKIQNLIMLAAMLALSLWAITTAANFIIEYNWWREVGQVGTWISLLWYSIAPFVGFPPVLPAGSSRVGRWGAIVRLGLD
jgi:hypothetical protein